jgi:hypothetical protein
MEPLLYEAAKIGNRVKFDFGSQVASDISHSLLGKSHTAKISSSNAYRLAKTSILITNTKQKLLSIINSLLTKEINSNKAEYEFKRALKQAHEDAYLNGMLAAGYKGDALPEKDKKWLTIGRYYMLTL